MVKKLQEKEETMTSRKLTARLREKDTIRHYYFLYGAEWLQVNHLPLLTLEEIHARAEELLDSLKMPDRCGIRAAATEEFNKIERATSIRSSSTWTAVEDMNLQALYNCRGANVRSLLPGRSRRDCAVRAKILGLENRSKWSDDEIKTLLQNIFSFGVARIVDLLPGRSVEDCQKVVDKNNLPGRSGEWTTEEKLLLKRIIKEGPNSATWANKAIELIPTRKKYEVMQELAAYWLLGSHLPALMKSGEKGPTKHSAGYIKHESHSLDEFGKNPEASAKASSYG